MKKIKLLLLSGIIFSASASAQINSNGLQFDGVDDYVQIPAISAYNIGTGDFTIELWVKMNTYQIFSTSLLFLSPVQPTQSVPTLGIMYNNLSSSFGPPNSLVVFLGSSSYSFTNVMLNSHTCRHIAVTRTSTTVSLYIDGSLFGFYFTSPINITVPYYIQLGSNFYDAYCGFMQELRFWNVARTQSQIQSTMNTTLSGFDSGLIGYWRLDDLFGSVNDFSVNNNDGIRYGPNYIAGCSNCTLPADTIYASGPTTACNFVQLVAQPGNTNYKWYKYNGGYPILVGTNSSSYSATVSETYFCVVTNSCGPVMTNHIAVTVQTGPPAAIITGPSILCSQGSVLLSANTGLTFTYQWRLNGGNISGATSISYTAAAPGNYDCIVTNLCASTVSNTITVAVSGPCGWGLEFTSSANNQVTISDNPAYSVGTNPFTFEVWIRASSFQSSTEPVILSKRLPTSGSFQLYLHSGGLSLRYGGASFVGNSNDLRDNTCHHIALTRSVNGTTKLYIDGAFVSTISFPTGWGISSTYPLWLGKDWQNPNPFNGLIHEFRFWNVERSQTQIQGAKDTYLTGQETGLIGYWRMNEGSGQIIQDFSPTNNSGVLGTTTSAESSDPVWSTGCVTYQCPLPPASITAAGPTTFCSPGTVTLNANTGTGLTYQWRLNGNNITGATSVSYLANSSGNYDCVVANTCANSTVSNSIVITVSGVCTNALLFNSSRATINDNAAYNLGVGDFTLEAWIRASYSTVPVSSIIISRRTTQTNGVMLFLSTAGKIRLQIGSIYLNHAGNDLRDNICHHVAVSRTGGTINYYVDGSLVSTLTATQNMNVTQSLLIGNDAVSSSSPFSGVIHEVRYWNLARSQAQIQAAKDTFLTGSESGLIGYWKMNEGSGQTIQDFSPTNNSGVLGTSSSAESSDPVWSYGCIINTCPPPAASIAASGSTVFCSPGSVTLNANTGVGLSYQWRLNGGNITGATASSYTAASTGNYDCIISNSCGSTTSNVIAVTVNSAPAASITAAGTTTFCINNFVTLNANTGTGLTYQWRLFGSPIIGATSSSYIAYYGGDYDCIVTNACGSSISNIITVMVISPPPATIQALGATIFCDPGSVTLEANIVPNTTYQWRLNGIPITGETLPSYLATATGNYDCIETTQCGNLTSNTISVSAELLPSAAVTAGGPTTFCSPGSVVLNVSTCSNCTYQWRESGVNISGANSSSYTATASGDYDCIVTNTCGARTSNNIIVTVVNGVPSALITASGSTTFCFPGAVTLNANTGTGITYQWRNNSVNISGAIAASYSATISGNYDCIVTNTCGSAVSNSIAVTVNPLPTASITASGSTTFCSPGSVTLNANTGTGFTYQWRNNSVNISGATSASYSATATGTYDCVVSNTCGSATSNSISVTVNSLPAATVSAAGPTTFCSPGSVTLNANTGTGFSYQWRNNSVNISGATASAYSANATGNYDCVVSNTCGSTTSNSIAVTVNTVPPATITASGATTFCSPGSVTLNANTGTGLSYQWRQNGANISGATASSYTSNATGSYDCVVTNTCGSTTSNTISVTVNILPATPGSITGQTTGVCASTKVYSIGAVSGATSYTWTVPSGASISSGQGTTSVNVLYTNTYTSGNISVVAVSPCGTSGASTISVSGVPAQPGNITGPTSVCHGQNNVIYNIAAVTGATSYTWTVPPGTQIKTGQGTVQIKVRFGNNAGNITVKANNACGSGPIRSLAIAMPCREEDISQSNFDVAVYPNPSSNDFTFMIDAAEKISCSINIYDLTGRVVELHQNISAGIEFKCGNELTDGIYFAEIISDAERKIMKLVKQK